jgi:hypothetical protein
VAGDFRERRRASGEEGKYYWCFHDGEERDGEGENKPSRRGRLQNEKLKLRN